MQSSSQIITNNKPTSSFLQAGCRSSRPTNSVKALKGKISHSMDLLTPGSPGGLPTLSLTTNSSWLPWGRVVMPLISPLMPVPQFLHLAYYCNIGMCTGGFLCPLKGLSHLHAHKLKIVNRREKSEEPSVITRRCL